MQGLFFKYIISQYPGSKKPSLRYRSKQSQTDARKAGIIKQNSPFHSRWRQTLFQRAQRNFCHNSESPDEEIVSSFNYRQSPVKLSVTNNEKPRINQIPGGSERQFFFSTSMYKLGVKDKSVNKLSLTKFFQR